jgi:hypothetical protein
MCSVSWFVLDDAGEGVLEGHTDEHHGPAIVTVEVDPLSDLAPASIQRYEVTLKG